MHSYKSLALLLIPLIASISCSTRTTYLPEELIAKQDIKIASVALPGSVTRIVTDYNVSIAFDSSGAKYEATTTSLSGIDTSGIEVEVALDTIKFLVINRTDQSNVFLTPSNFLNSYGPQALVNLDLNKGPKLMSWDIVDFSGKGKYNDSTHKIVGLSKAGDTLSFDLDNVYYVQSHEFNFLKTARLGLGGVALALLISSAIDIMKF